LGGGDIWDYVGNNIAYARRIAAMVPVAGTPTPDVAKAQTIATANIAVWVTHNDGDPEVPVSNAIGYVNDINAAPIPPTPRAKVTVFHLADHDAWTQTYDLSL